MWLLGPGEPRGKGGGWHTPETKTQYPSGYYRILRQYSAIYTQWYSAQWTAQFGRKINSFRSIKNAFRSVAQPGDVGYPKHFEILRSISENFYLADNKKIPATVIQEICGICCENIWGRIQVVPNIPKILFQNIPEITARNIPPPTLLPEFGPGCRGFRPPSRCVFRSPPIRDGPGGPVADEQDEGGGMEVGGGGWGSDPCEPDEWGVRPADDSVEATPPRFIANETPSFGDSRLTTLQPFESGRRWFAHSPRRWDGSFFSRPFDHMSTRRSVFQLRLSCRLNFYKL